jgi:hypothetical protein
LRPTTAGVISTADAEDEARFSQGLREFEQQHPDTSIEDLLDLEMPLPEDTDFGQIVNQVNRNSVTIERTRGCLFVRG